MELKLRTFYLVTQAPLSAVILKPFLPTGVETTRHFLLEWLSYTFRYIPVGLLDVIPQQINWRPPSYFGRDDLETRMMSESAGDWVRKIVLFFFNTPSCYSFDSSEF